MKKWIFRLFTHLVLAGKWQYEHDMSLLNMMHCCRLICQAVCLLCLCRSAETRVFIEFSWSPVAFKNSRAAHSLRLPFGDSRGRKFVLFPLLVKVLCSGLTLVLTYCCSAACPPAQCFWMQTKCCGSSFDWGLLVNILIDQISSWLAQPWSVITLKSLNC